METLDTYGMTPLHRMASNNLPVGVRFLDEPDQERVEDALDVQLEVETESEYMIARIDINKACDINY